MIDERYHALAFRAAGLDTEEARLLADALADEILALVSEAAGRVLQDAIGALNRMGHALHCEQDEPGRGEFSYIDRDEGRAKLRVALDLVVSTGYAHLLPDPSG